MKVENNNCGKRQSQHCPLARLNARLLPRARRASFHQTLQVGARGLSRTLVCAAPAAGTGRQTEESRNGDRDSQTSEHADMHRHAGLSPKWPRALWCLLLLTPCLLHAATAEITCRSCHLGNKWRARELLIKLNTEESGTGVQGELLGTRGLPCQGGLAECAPNPEPRLKRSTGSRRTDDFAQSKVSATFGTRARRSSGGDLAGDPAAADHQDAQTGRRVLRAELRWSGEERRSAGGRHEEPKVNSSTFALTGDSSHNQAMVHWSGQNSSVSVLTAIARALWLRVKSVCSQTCVCFNVRVITLTHPSSDEPAVCPLRGCCIPSSRAAELMRAETHVSTNICRFEDRRNQPFSPFFAAKFLAAVPGLRILSGDDRKESKAVALMEILMCAASVAEFLSKV